MGLERLANRVRATLLVEWKLPHCVAFRRRGASNPIASNGLNKKGKNSL
jgi:hypothetical protein